MGRPARNHGVTGGHGCHPLPGQRPNYNHHVLWDKTLQKMVKNARQEPGISTKLETLNYLPKNGEKPKRVHSDNSSDSASIIGLRRVCSNRSGDSVSMKVPKRVNIDSQSDILNIKEPHGVHCDGPIIKEPKRIHSDTHSINELSIGLCDTPITKEPKIDCPYKENEEGHFDIPCTKEQLMLGNYGTPNGSETMQNPKRMESEGPEDSVSIKEPEMSQGDSQSESLHSKESHGGHCGSAMGFVNIKEPERINREKQFDSSKGLRLVHSGRQDDHKLAEFQVEPPSQVQSTQQSNQQTTVISEQQSFPPKGMSLSRNGVPTTSEQVNIYIICKDLIFMLI